MNVLRKPASKLGVSTHWLETGQVDPAQALARLVLKYQGRPLPPRAFRLARSLLSNSG
jgi:hypothetical protein